MYEFFDTHGERVTVRSARTLGKLLGSGEIVATTRFRRTDEPEFEPAGTHAELCSIAAQFGISLGEPSGADTASSPVVPRPEQPPAAAPLVSTQPGLEPGNAPVASGPWSALAHPDPLLRAPAPMSQRYPSRPQQTPPIKLGPLSHEGPPRRIGIVLAYCAAAAFGGLAAGALAAIVLRDTALFVLAAGLGSGASAWVAERSLAARRPAVMRWEIAAGSIVFGAACLILTRGSGLVVALPVCAVLWAKLRARTAQPPGHRRNAK